MILLVDDEPDLLEMNKEFLESQNYKIICAANGNEAKKILQSNKIDLVVSDIKMPECDGIQLTSWIKLQKIDCKVILMTGFADAASTQAAYDLGVSAILAKPVKSDELLRSIKETENISAENVDESQYGRIQIEDFLCGKNITFPIYVKVQKDKFLKVAHTGEDLDIDRIQAMKFKGVHELWLKKNDFETYNNLSKNITGAIKNNPNIDSAKKAKVINLACEVAFESFRVSGFDPALYQAAEQTLADALIVCSYDKIGANLLAMLTERGELPYTHAASCALVSIMLSKVMGWSSRQNTLTLAIASFFHDIGILTLPNDIQEKKLQELNPDELTLFQTHPILSAQILEKMNTKNDNLIRTVLQHHENGRETGYPNHIKRSEIIPMAKTVALIDVFCEKLATTELKSNPILHDIVNEFSKNNSSDYDHAALLALDLLVQKQDINAANVIFSRKIKTSF